MKKATMTVTAASLAVAILLLAGGCGSEEEGESATKLQGAIVIILDTVRPDHLSCYGCERDTSPALTGLAQEGVLFRQAVSFAPWTLPSMVSFFTGKRADRSTFDTRLKYSLAEDFEKAGFATAGITEGGFVSGQLGFDRGFSRYVDEGGDVTLLGDGQSMKLDMAQPEGRIENTFRQAREWLAAQGKEKFFLYIHTYEAHTPYTRRHFVEGMDPGDVGETFTLQKLEALKTGQVTFDKDEMTYLKALYDGGVRKCDDQVGELLAYLEESGLDDRTLVVVTSDHGEELDDHYSSFSGEHGHSLRDELVLVPLIISNPCETYALREVENQVRLMDVMPTVLDALDVPTERECEGESLLPMMRGEETRGRLVLGGATKSGPPRAFLRWLGYKSIKILGPQRSGPPLSPSPPVLALYDLRADPDEKNNIAASKPDIIDKMMELFASMEKAEDEQSFDVPDHIDDALRERLKGLGYIR